MLARLEIGRYQYESVKLPDLRRERERPTACIRDRAGTGWRPRDLLVECCSIQSYIEQVTPITRRPKTNLDGRHAPVPCRR